MATPPVRTDDPPPSEAQPAEAPRRSRPEPAPARRERPAGLRALSIVVRVGVGVAILFVAFAIVGVLNATKPASERVENAESVRMVGVVRVTPVPVARRWVAYGTARALREASISAQVSAEVLERPAEIEDAVPVQQGQLIVQLDPSDFQDRLQAAEQTVAALQAQVDSIEVDRDRLREQIEQSDREIELTRSELTRLREARERGAGSEIEVDRLDASIARMERQKSSLEQLYDLLPTRRARLAADMQSQVRQRDLAKRDLERTRVTSPIDGSLERVMVREGELVSIGQTIARVVDLRRIEVPLRVASSAFNALRVGDEMALRVDGPDPTTWTARVARLGSEADPATRTVTVYLELDQDPDGTAPLLLPGRFVTADVRAASPEARLVVPRTAIADDTLMVVTYDAKGVARAFPHRVRVLFHVDASIPELDPVETQWAVLAPGSIEEGELVITTNLDELEANTPIELPAGVGRGATPPGAGDGEGG